MLPSEAKGSSGRDLWVNAMNKVAKSFALMRTFSRHATKEMREEPTKKSKILSFDIY